MLVNKNKRAFTLIELLAVIVVLGVILAIAIPSISGIISSARKNTFKSNIILLIKQIDRYSSTHEDFDPSYFGVDDVNDIAGMSPSNYKDVYAIDSGNDSIYIYVVGKNSWEGLVGYGTLDNITVTESEECELANLNNEEYAASVALDDGSYVSVGTTADGDYSTNRNGIISKHNAIGAMMWTKTFGGTDWDIFYDVISVSDGYIAVGESRSTDGDLAGLNKGDADAIIVKFDLNGNVVWTKTFGGTDGEYFMSITATTDGYVVAGSTYSDDGDVSGLTHGTGWCDGVIVKFDLNGNLVWTRVYGGTRYDIFESVVKTNDGYIIVGKSESSDGDLADIHVGWYDALIIKYDLNGNLVWAKTFGGTYEDEFKDIIKVTDGYIIVGSSSSEDGDLTGLDSTEGRHPVIAKYNLDGNLTWVKTHVGMNMDTFNAVEALGDGYIAVGLVNTEVGFGYSSITVKYDLTGNVVWENSDAITGNYYLNDVTVNGENMVAVGFAMSEDNVNFNYTEDGVLVKYDTNGDIVWEERYAEMLCAASGPCHLSQVDTSDTMITAMENDGNNYLISGVDLAKMSSFLVKYDGNGNIVWEKEESIFVVNIDRDLLPVSDGYIIAGASLDGDDMIPSIRKYNKEGTLLWERKRTDLINASYSKIEAVGNNLYAILSYGFNDTYLQKMDANGDVLFTSDDVGKMVFDLEPVSDGYIISATTFDSETDNPIGRIEKYDSSDNLVWSTSYHLGTGSMFTYITSDNTGIVISAIVDGVGMLVKYDLTGSYIWSKESIYINSESPTDVEEIDGNYLLTGASLAKYDNNGNLLWGKSAPDGEIYLTTRQVNGAYYSISGILEPFMFPVAEAPNINIYNTNGALVSSKKYREGEIYLQCETPDGGGGGVAQ